jgi:hypothetical protein
MFVSGAMSLFKVRICKVHNHESVLDYVGHLFTAQKVYPPDGSRGHDETR